MALVFLLHPDVALAAALEGERWVPTGRILTLNAEEDLLVEPKPSI